MEIIVERAAGLDIHRKSITACVRTPGSDGGRVEQVRTFAAFLDGLTALRGWLLDTQVTHVAMEATSSYWLPVWRVLEDGEPFDELLCNARHVKHVPGRKTDVKDASWRFTVRRWRPCRVLASPQTCARDRVWPRR